MTKASILFVAAAIAAIPARQTATDIRGIHDSVLKAVFKNGIPGSFVVYAEYRVMRPPDDRAWQAIGTVPAELRQMVASAASREAPPSTDVHTSDQFPAGAHIVPTSEAATLIRGGPRDKSGYPALQQKYGAGSVLSLSKPLITSDGFDVLVHYSHGCGSACGSQGYVWLHRWTPTGPWVAKLVVTAGS